MLVQLLLRPSTETYVDDLLRSCDTTHEAKQLVSEVNKLLASGGFQLTKFCSSSRDVFNSTSEEYQAPNVKYLQLELFPEQKTLGIYWSPDKDEFIVKVNIRNCPLSRRGLFSMASQLYNPLGLLQPFILPVKHIMQCLCDLKLRWNEIIPETIRADWMKWLSSLPQLQELFFPCCVRLPWSVERYELYVFCDGSSSGYGAVAYLCMVGRNNYHCSLYGQVSCSPK